MSFSDPSGLFPEDGFDGGNDWDGDKTEPASVEPAERTADPVCENDDDLVDADTHSDEIDPGQDMHDAIREGAFNPEYALGIYCNKILLHIYFESHFSVLDVALLHLRNKNFKSHSYFVQFRFVTKPNADSGFSVIRHLFHMPPAAAV